MDVRGGKVLHWLLQAVSSKAWFFGPIIPNTIAYIIKLM